MATFDKEGAIEQLKELGVELTGEESVKELKALLKEHASDEDESDEDEDSEEGEEGSEEGAGKKGKFKVSDSNGKVVATVKTEKEAEELAKVYGGKVIKA